MQQAVALVGEQDRALRELMRGALQRAGYSVIEAGGAAQLEATLRSRHLTSTPRVLLVVCIAMCAGSSDVVVGFTRRRASLGHPAPHILLTCEFGTLGHSALPEVGLCISAGILEKPFELALLQSVAARCQMSSAGVSAQVPTSR